jgi:hypothetical protein
MISGIGTGKTYMLLLKVKIFCEKYPNSLALIARKEYTDLRDSTLKDWVRYFPDVPIDGNKECSFPNGSKIMFRHAAELNVLKNINLSIAALEQAEEFENDTQFTFIRDRLRRDNAPYQQLICIANANGHNWMWRKWVNNPQAGYELVTATTWDNAINLPKAFLDDMKVMAVDQPHHYRQFVENDFQETDSDDALFTASKVYESAKLDFPHYGAYGRIMAIDVARYGDDETVFSVIEKVGPINFIHLHQETWRNHSLMETVGKTLDLKRQLMVDLLVVDDAGLGGGVTDRLRELKYKIMAFNGAGSSSNPTYLNARCDAFFNLKDMIDRKQIKIMNDFELQEQLLSVRIKFRSNELKSIVSKEDMRKDGLKSPDRADALAMACYYKDAVIRQNNDYTEAKGKLEFVNGISEYKLL